MHLEAKKELKMTETKIQIMNCALNIHLKDLHRAHTNTQKKLFYGRIGRFNKHSTQKSHLKN